MPSLVLGSARAQFTITLSAAASEPVSVEWFTKDGTALAGRDYEANSGTVLFAPGEVTKIVEVFVHGRTVETEDRVFYVRMLPPVNAILADEVGACVIHVDTTGSTPIMTVVIPKGEKGERGYSAYEIALQNGFVGTEAEWLESLKPDPAEVALEVAPLLVADHMPVTAKGTETLTPKDTDTLAGVAGRIPYMPLAKKAIAPPLTAGVNVIPIGAFVGDVPDPAYYSGFNVVAIRGGAPVSVTWSYLPDSNEIRIEDGQAGDIPIAVRVAVGGKDASFASVTANGRTSTLRKWFNDLASKVGAALIGYSQGSTGAALRTLESRLRDAVSVKDFGAIGDGSYHPVSEWYTAGFSAYRGYADFAAVQADYPHVTSSTQSIDWAAFQAAANTGRLVLGPAGSYVLTDWVQWIAGGGFIGEGHSAWTPGSYLLTKITGGTNILMYGTGQRVLLCDHVGADGGTYGQMNNPDAGSPYTAFGSAPKYAMTDLTNGNAVGAARATLRPFSAAFVIPADGNVIFRDFRLVPYFNGQNGYVTFGETGLGADWDVGIANNNGSRANIDNVQVVGYWRIAAYAKLASPVGTEVVQGESDRVSNCLLQGYRSLLVRTMDQYYVMSSSDAGRTVRVPWSASHRWPTAGQFRLAGTDRTYTGLNYGVDGGGNPYLEFTGVTGPLGSYGNIFTIRAVTSHFGTSGTVIEDCTMGGLTHHSRLPATSNLLTPRFALPSAAVEISGGPLRAIQFANCTIVGSEDILLYLNFCSEVQFRDTYFEGQAAFTQLESFDNQIGRGGRFIATPGTINVDFLGCTNHNPSVDKRPKIATGGLAETRFVSGTGLFNPRSFRDDSESLGYVNSSGQQVMRNMAGELTLQSSANTRIIHGDTHGMIVGSSDSSRSKIQALASNFLLTAPLRVQLGNTADTVWFQADSGQFYGLGSNKSLGNGSSPWTNLYVTLITIGTRTITYSAGSPEGAVTATPGSLHLDATGKLWLKTTGTGNTGWTQK